MTWNLCDSIITRKRSNHARSLLAARYEKLFASDCRMKSLISRLNRCSREYSGSLFSGVPGLRCGGYPTVKFDCSNLTTTIRNSFVGKWGDENGGHGVDSEIFYSCQDALLDKFSGPNKAPDYEPKNDTTRVLLGGEFKHRFSRSRRDKRLRDPTETSSGTKG